MLISFLKKNKTLNKGDTIISAGFRVSKSVYFFNSLGTQICVRFDRANESNLLGPQVSWEQPLRCSFVHLIEIMMSPT